MHKQILIVGSMEDLRSHGGRLSVEGLTSASKEMKAEWMMSVLGTLGYATLDRDDKGLVRIYLQTATGYSRAQVARYIGVHQKSLSMTEKPSGRRSVFSMRIPVAISFALLLIVLTRSGADRSASVLNVLNTERSTIDGAYLNAVALKNSEERTVIVRTVVQASDGSLISTPLLAVHQQNVMAGGMVKATETLIAPTTESLQTRVAQRKTARQRSLEDGRIATRPDITIDRNAYPAYDGATAHAAAGTVWDIPLSGKNGQILMIQNGRPVWHDFPYLEEIRSSAPHGSEMTRRAGGSRSGGAADSQPVTTTVIQGGSTTTTTAPSGWTDDGSIVYLTDSSANVGIGTSEPGNKLEVVGSISGASLYITGSMSGAGLADCDATSNKLVYDATTGRFACATDQTVGTGLSITTGDERYVQKQGSTMTGTLVIDLTSGNIGLEVVETASASTLFANTSLRSSGSLVFEGSASGSTLYIATSINGAGLTDCDISGTSKLLWDATTGRFSCGTDTDTNTTYTAGRGLGLNGTSFSLNDVITGSLLEFNTVSGAVVYAGTSLRSSGSLVFEGSASGSSLWVSTFSGAGLTDCDLSTNKIVYDSATEKFSCASDVDTNTTYTAGRGLTLNGTSFSLNDTITGSLVRFTTLSGSVLYGKTSISSSGSLTWEGAASGSTLYIATSVNGAGLTDCDAANQTLAWDSTTGRFSCGTDSDTTYTAGRGLTLNSTSFSLNSTITGSLVRFSALSGSTIYAKNSISSSGSLTWEGAASGSTLYIATSINGAGLTDCDAANQTLAWDASTGRFSCGTDSDTTYTAGKGLGLNGTSFSLNDTITGSLVRFTTISGSTLYAKNSLSTSGSLTWEGAASGSTLYIATSINGAGLTDCDLSTSVLRWDSTTGRFSCGAIAPTAAEVGTASFTGAVLTIGNDRYINDNGDTMTGALVINVTNGLRNTIGLNVVNTISGAVVHGEKSITSSGTLVFEGSASGSSLWVSTFSGAGLTDCDLSTNKIVYDSATEKFSCASDVDTNTTYTAGRGLTLNGTSFSLNDTITGSLVRFTTISGATLYAKNSVSSSGSLTWEGAASGSTLYVATSINGAGLTDCDLSTNTLRWDSTTGRFSCGMLSAGSPEVGTASFTGAVLTIGNDRYINDNGDTMTGTLVIDITNGLRNTIGLNVINTLSGAVVHAEKTLSSSGTLVFEGSASGSSLWVSTFSGAGLTDCDLSTSKIVYDSTTERFSCATDLNTGNTYTAGQGLTLNGTSFSLNSTITGALVRFNTVSGSVVYAKTTVASSGSLVWEEAASGSSLYIASSLQGAGLTDCDAANQTLAWDITTGRFSCGTDSDTTYTAGRGLTLNGTSFSLNDTITGSLVRFTALSGSVLYGKTSISSSGSLTWEGAASGASLWVSTFEGAGLTDCDAAGQTLNWDATNKQFVCGADESAGSGMDQNAADERYVRKSGSTMTGALVIDMRNGVQGTIGLNAINTVSGAVIHAEKTLSSSGTLVFEGAASGSSLYIATSINGAGLTDCDAANQTLAWDASTGRFSCGTDSDTTYTAGRGLTLNGTSFSLNDTITGSLVRFTTISGATLYAQNSLSSSGSLTWEGAASGSTLYVATSINGAGLTDCDLSTNTLRWDSTTGRFSCGTIAPTAAEVGTASFTGAVLTIGNDRYINDNGDTMTGALVINVTNGLRNTIGLNVINTLSGAVVHAEKSLTTSGTLVFESAASGSSLYIASSLQGAGLTDCDAANQTLAWDITTGRFSCGTDSDTTYTAGRGLGLNGTSFSLNSTITGSLVRFSALSGSTVYAKNSISSSGSLTWEGAASGSTLYVATSINGAGLTDCDLSTNVLRWDSTTGRFSCGTATTSAEVGTASFTGAVLTIGNDRWVNDNGDTMTGALVINVTNGTRNTLGLNVLNTISGAVVHGEKSLTSSGTLVVEGISMFNSTVNVSGSILPTVTNKFDLGSSTLRWRDLYLSGGTLRMGVAGNQAALTYNTSNQTFGLNVSGRNTADLKVASGAVLTLTSTAPELKLDIPGSSSGARLVKALNGGVSLYNKVAGQGLLTSELTFDGAGDYIDVGSNVTYVQSGLPFTFAAWVYLENYNQTYPLIASIRTSGTNAYMIGFSNDASYQGMWIGSNTTFTALKTNTTPATLLNTWKHVAVVYNGGNPASASSYATYIDGAAVSNVAAAAIGSYANTTTRFGETLAGQYDWQGKMDDIRLYGTALDAGDVSGLYNGGNGTLGGEQSGLNGWWKLDDATGAVATDTMGVANGNLTGTAWATGEKPASAGSSYNEVLVFSSTNGLLSNESSINTFGAVEGRSVIQGQSVRFLTGNIERMRVSSGGYVGIGTNNPNNALSVSGSVLVGGNISNRFVKSGVRMEVVGTLSGSRLYASTSLRSSGSLVFEGSASGSSLWVSTFSGAGLTDCDLSTSKLLYDSATERFSCGTINTAAEVGTASFTGAVLTIGNDRWVNDNGDTMTGALVINVTNGLRNTIGLNVINTMSGAVVHAEKSLTSSGTLVFEGAASGSSLYVATSINGAGLTDCDLSTSQLKWDATTGRFSCGTISTAPEVGTASFTGAVLTIGNDRWVNDNGDTMTGTLIIDMLSGTVGLEVIEIASGSTIYASTSLMSSGTLVVENTLIRGSGALTVIQSAEFGTGAYMYSSGTILALDGTSPTGTNKHILFGYLGNFDTNLYRFAASTLKTDGSFFVTGTVSAAVIKATSSLSSSGSLTWEGVASGSTLYVATSINGAGLTDCDLSSQKLTWNSATGRFGCDVLTGGSTEVGTSSFSGGVLRMGDSRYVKLSGDTMTGALQLRGLLFASGSSIGEQSGFDEYVNLLHSGLATDSTLRITKDGDFVNIGSIQAGETRLTVGGTFALNQSYSLDTFAHSIATADFNGDGKKDLVTTSLTVDTASVLLNSGTGGFLNETVYSAGDGPRTVVAADFNGDGKPDFATANYSDNNVSVFINKGNGTFKLKADYSAGTNTRGLAAADFNADGFNDLVASNEFDDSMSILLNNRNGTFAAPANYATGDLPQGVATGDLNGDGKIDVVVANNNAETVSVLINIGAGTFAPKVDYAAGVDTRSVAIGDINGDNKPDVIAANGGEESVSVFMNTGLGVLASRVNYPTQPVAGGSYAGEVNLGDLNGDGKLDLVVVNNPGYDISVYMNSGTGGFLARSNYTAGINPTDSAIADFNGDGKMDIAASYADTAVAAIFMNQPRPLFYASVGTGGVVGIGTANPGAKLSVSGAVIISNNGRLANARTDTGVSLEVIGTMSGTKIFSNRLASSGSLVIKSLSRTGSGAATVVSAAGQTGAYISASGAGILALDGYSRTQTGSNAHILFGYRGNFDVQLFRSGSPGSGELVVRTQVSDPARNVFRIISNNTTANNNVFRVESDGQVFADGAYSGAGADYAEWFYSTDTLAQGEVVCVDVTRNNAVSRCTADADGNVMGIVSTNPAFVGNRIGGVDGIVPPGYYMIGLIGQVPAKVIIENGEAIRPGDSLTAGSTPGYARRARAGESTVGVALEGLASGEGVVNVLISRRNQSLTVEAVEENVLKTIAAMEIEDEVQIMVASTLDDLNVDSQISTEVERQLAGFQDQDLAIEAIREELNMLKAQLALINSQSGSTTTVITQTGSYNQASSMEIDGTLTTGGDARIGGDLHIDGALNASSLFVPNGLSIDGGVVMNGLLDTMELRVASGAVVDGVMTINGALVLGSGAYLDAGSGALSIGELIVHNSLFVMGDVTIEGLATFLGDVEVKGELIVSGKQAGFAMIPATGTSVTIYFGSGMKAVPVVTATPNGPVYSPWWVSAPTQTGFTIHVASPVAADTLFSWISLSTASPVTIIADVLENGSLVFPTDDRGVPVSSNMVWNACIRNITLLDSEGQPLSCSRYHDQFTWTHPDLLISFIWNTSITPPLLKVPDGYSVEVTESAQSIQDAFDGGDAEGVEIGEESEDSNNSEETASSDSSASSSLNSSDSSDSSSSSISSIPSTSSTSSTSSSSPQSSSEASTPSSESSAISEEPASSSAPSEPEITEPAVTPVQ